jgi:hypothetical protein
MLHKNKKRIDPRYFLHETVNPEELLIEGQGVEFGKDILQAIVAGSAEYGLGAVTLPAAGAGLAIGPAVETSIDGLFAAESVLSTISTIAGIGETMGDVGKMIEEASKLRGNLIRGDLEAFYQKVNNLVAKFIKMAGPEGEEALAAAVEKIRAPINVLLTRLTDPLVDGIKVTIPDAAIGLGVSAGLRLAIVEASEVPYTAAAGAIDLSEDLKSFVLEPGVAAEFFKELGEMLIELVLGFKEKIEDTGWLATTAAAIASIPLAGLTGGTVSPITVVALKKLGPDGLQSLSETIRENLPALVELVNIVVDTIIPIVLACLAISQSLLSGDFKAAMGAPQQELPVDDLHAPEHAPPAGTLGPGGAQEAPEMAESVRWDLGKNGIFVLQGT